MSSDRSKIVPQASRSKAMQPAIRSKAMMPSGAEPDIRELNIEEARILYDLYLAKDFPPNERKPFSAISSMMKQQRYIVYGAYLENYPAGYACLAVEKDRDRTYALLDYFAVVKDLRGKGIGTAFLKKLIKNTPMYDCVLIESESADMAEDAADSRTREKRISFYKNCGAMDTGVRSFLYYVNYDILAFTGGNIPKDPEVFRDITELMYRRMYPKDWFPALVKVTIK